MWKYRLEILRALGEVFEVGWFFSKTRWPQRTAKYECLFTNELIDLGIK